LDTIYARCNILLWVINDQSIWFEMKALCNSWRLEGEIMARVLFGPFTMVGSQTGEGIWTLVLLEFICEWRHSSCWCQSWFFLLVAILGWFKLWPKFLLDPLQWWDGNSRLENVSICNMLCQKNFLDGEGQGIFLYSYESMYA